MDADHIAHESQGPAIPATPDLRAEHDEPLGPAAGELRVGRLFASFSNAKRCPIRVGGAWLPKLSHARRSSPFKPPSPRILPRLDAMPECASTAPVTVSSAGRATVMT